MRLLTKNTLVYLAVAIVVFILGGFVFYFRLNQIISEEATEGLLVKKQRVLDYVRINRKLPEPGWADEIMLSFTPAQTDVSDAFKDTTVFNELEHEPLPYRELFFSISLPEALYTAELRKPMLESEDLEEAIFGTLVIICLVLLVLMPSVNYLFSRYTWKPFFRIIRKLEDFNVENQEALDSEHTGTVEFKALDEAVKKMTAKLSADFQNLRSFTENASHEIQTPLAIIKTKLEVLIQSEHNERDMQAIQAVYEAANRLSKLNQALLLLTRIENRQFSKKEQVDLSHLVEKHIANYAEWIEAKGIMLNANIARNTSLNSNAPLVDVLLGNILGNAVRHNIDQGRIKIDLSAHELKISNTGQPLNIAPDRLFERFAKNEQSSESLGLGLAIVKKIADTEQLTVSYAYTEGWHTIGLRF